MKNDIDNANADVSSATDTQEMNDEPEPVIVRTATSQDAKYAYIILHEMIASAKARGTGIGYRPIEMIFEKMDNGEAIIATTNSGKWVGFSYVEIWEQGKFISNGGMIVSPEYREKGIATVIKKHIVELCRERFPQANIFSITSSAAIMKLNTRFGFTPVSFAEITNDKSFWNKCRNCVNYNILERKDFKNCLCTALLFNPQ